MDFVFFTGAPGSKWSAVSQEIEKLPMFNTSDRNANRQYVHGSFTGHVGAYFGTGMEFEAIPDAEYLARPWTPDTSAPKMLVKSHEWAEKLSTLTTQFPKAPIIMVHRPNPSCFDWWQEAGGFDIKYPRYAEKYVDLPSMSEHIALQNSAMLQFAADHNLEWSRFSNEWLSVAFGSPSSFDETRFPPDLSITIYTP